MNHETSMNDANNFKRWAEQTIIQGCLRQLPENPPTHCHPTIIGATDKGRLRIQDGDQEYLLTRHEAICKYAGNHEFAQSYENFRRQHISPETRAQSSIHLHDPAEIVRLYGHNPTLRQIYQDDPEYQAAFAAYDATHTHPTTKTSTSTKNKKTAVKPKSERHTNKK